MSTSLNLKRAFEEEPHAFLQPSAQLYNGFLQLAKSYLDPLVGSVVESQTEQQKLARQARKRKRRNSDVDGNAGKEDVLRLKQVHVTELDVRQVWQQAKRVLSAGAGEVERELSRITDEEGLEPQEDKVDKTVRFDGEPDSSDQVINEDDYGSIGEEGVDWEYDGEDHDSTNGELANAMNGAATDEESLDIGDETPLSGFSDGEDAEETLVKDKHGLNDGFFNIDQFNKQTQFLEHIDARGDSDDGAASDEEEVDWGIDPLTFNPQPATMESKRHRNTAPNDDLDLDDGDNESDDDNSPTFGDMEVNTSEEESDLEGKVDEDQVLDDGGLSNTNDIKYKDFFAPPARQKRHKPRPRKTPEGDGPSAVAGEPSRGGNDDEEMQRTMSAVHRDLFEDDLSDNADEAEANGDGGQRKSNLSSHERRQLALRAEIRRLEAENVAAKHWSLAGETLAPSRPINSLLEEDLDFERTGKPVPVITEQVSEEIENLIKRRILAREFDEVIRRRPNELLSGAADPRRRGRADGFELSTSKHEKGLADEYADQHLRDTDPAFVDKRVTALRTAHKDIETQWASVSAQLDSLCNWHYKPKPPAPNLEVRVDAPAIRMEDARPTAAEGDMGAGTMLAPQEVWSKDMDDRADGEVVTKGGASFAREELTREQKKRRRSREKERAKKAGANDSGNPQVEPRAASAGKVIQRSKSHKEQADVMGQLKKGGVRVIDKKGALRDIEGRRAKSRNNNTGGVGQLKL